MGHNGVERPKVCSNWGATQPQSSGDHNTGGNVAIMANGQKARRPNELSQQEQPLGPQSDALK